MPELALFYSVGALCSLISAVAFALSELSLYRRTEYKILQSNLKKVDQRWSQLSGRVEPLIFFDSDRREIKKAQTTYILFGFAAIILSWLGFFFLGLIWLSLKKLTHNRLEMALFQSPLAEQKLDLAQIQSEWSRIQALGFD